MQRRFAIRVLPWSLLLLSLTPAASAQERTPRAQGPTVQTRWRLAAIGLDARPELRIQPMLRRVERALKRELPGLEVRFEGRYRRYELSSELRAKTLSEPELVSEGLRLAEADGLTVADYDVVFVFTPYGGRYFGLSHVDYTAKDGRSARGAYVHSRPFDLLLKGVVNALEDRYPPGFVPDPNQRPLPPALRQALVMLLKLLEEPLRALLELPRVRESLLEPTLAHELGHYFAPGDPDVRDGYQEGWLRHATGPTDNPDGHEVECVMFKGRDAPFYLKKLVAIRGRMVVFCDPCREKLGLRRTRPHPAWF